MPNEIDYAKREFLKIYCDLELNGHQLLGYLFVIQGNVNSVSIFIGDNIVDLYSADLLVEDNQETLNDITEHSIED